MMPVFDPAQYAPETPRVRAFLERLAQVMKTDPVFDTGSVHAVPYSGNVVEIRKVGVARDLRGHGYGRALMKTVLTLADEAGVDLYIQAQAEGADGPDTSALRAWYMRLGFRPLEGTDRLFRRAR